MEKFDYIIVGGGTAGCALANRLSAVPNVKVLLLEAGGTGQGNLWLKIPIGYFKTMHNPKTDWCFRTEPDPGLAGRSIDWPRGKTLGGSSAINGLLYVRGQKEDYDGWRDAGNEGWGFNDVLPYFKKAEDQEHGSDEYHGIGGPIAITDIRTHRNICNRFIDAAVELGIPHNKDFNGAIQEGAGYFQVTVRNGFRCSTMDGYLNPVKHRKNLKIETNVTVSKINFKDGCASAITAISSQGSQLQFSLNTGGEVILSAGAIGSPHILKLSGIGPGEELQKHGIPVTLDLAGVGRNLQDHLQIRSVYEVKEPTLNDQVHNPLRKMLIGAEYLFLRKGPMTMSASQVAVFARADKDSKTPDVQFHFQPLSTDRPGVPPHRFSGVTFSVCQLRPESKGSIVIKSPHAQDAPEIHPCYLSTEKDQRIAVEGLKLGRRLANTRAFSPQVVREVLPGNAAQSDEDLLAVARQIGETIYHPVGTCKMGNDSNAVVDHRLKIRGIENIRVVDASIMPTIPSGNTCAPTVMVAEKAADMILADRRSG